MDYQKVKMKEKTYCLIIPVLNRLASLKLLYDSIVSFNKIKILLFDNGSGKETVDFINKASSEPDTFAAFEKFNKGASYARNEGLNFAFDELKADGVFFIDSDVVLNKGCLDEMIAFSEKNKNSAVFSNDQKKLGFSYREFLAPDFVPKINKEPFATTECCFIPKSVYDAVGYFDEMFYPVYCEDMDYFYRAKLAGIKLLSCPKAYHYHFGDSIPSEDAEFEKYKNSRFPLMQQYYMRKWGGAPGNEAYIKPFIAVWPEYYRMQKVLVPIGAPLPHPTYFV